MPAHEAPALSLALFCKVVDNFGDIGICWRLARQLQDEHGIHVQLWVDDLPSFRCLCPAIDIEAAVQQQGGVEVIAWRARQYAFTPGDIADIVIEFFGCDIPDAYVAAMAQCTPAPVWLNYEGLSAEDWVEGCHRLPSPHPRLPLTKHFYFPGFTGKTGGLLREAGLTGQRRQFQTDPAAVTGFLAQLGLTAEEIAAFKVSLFCYPHAPVAALFAAWRDGDRALTCLVPEGVAVDAVQAFFGAPATVGSACTQGMLTVRILPFVAQPDYDRLLWACDMNIVRGEDSFVRAQWAGKPFIWHIYPQEKNLHHKKLRAFLQRYAEGLESLSDLSLAWNDALHEPDAGPAAWSARWSSFQDAMPEMLRRAGEWERQMQANGDLTANMISFAMSLRIESAEK